MIAVREARPADAESLATLNRDFNAVERDVAQVRESLRASTSAETVLVAEEAGTVIGFLCLQMERSVCYDAPWAEITELFVVADHRGKGVGQALVRHADTRARRDGASELIARTDRENAAAQAVFRRLGLNTAAHVVFRRLYSSGD